LAEGFRNYHFQAPYGKNERILALVREAVSSRAEAQAIHNDFMEKNVSKARVAGTLSHEAYFAFTPPGKPESLELLALDVWMDASGMAAYYQDAEWQGGFQRLFAEPPPLSLPGFTRSASGRNGKRVASRGRSAGIGVALGPVIGGAVTQRLGSGFKPVLTVVAVFTLVAAVTALAVSSARART